MSVRDRISVLRFFQLSTGRLYDRLQDVCNLDLVRLGEEGLEAPSGVRELPPAALAFSVLDTPAGCREVSQTGDELGLAEARGLRERARRLPVFRPQKVTFRAPEDRLELRLGRGPDVVLHDPR